MKMVKAFISLMALMGSSAALAHPGHDHGDWSAMLIHFLWIFPAALAVCAAIFYLNKKTSSQSKKQS